MKEKNTKEWKKKNQKEKNIGGEEIDFHGLKHDNMPFKSEAQRKFLWMKHPEIARRWSKEYPTEKASVLSEMKKRVKGRKK